jgi:UDP-GlcNAc:undecaprenyl-phosphate/decaprenyl-phosphate GlcNAc-1-phosphate transferase
MSDGWQMAIAGVLAFSVVVALVPLCRRFALARGITDTPEPGKVHGSPTPYLGGISIAAAAILCSLLVPGWESEADDAALILVAAVMVSLAGLFDDVRGMGPLPRLVVEVAAALLAVAAGARIQLFGDVVDVIVSVVALVILTNSFNLLDNMDSAAGAIAATIATALAVTALLEGQILVGGVAVVVASASLGFLVYNWHPASIFMGDTGSLFLGFLLAVIALKLRTGVGHFPSAVAAVLLVAPAVLDTALVVISRVRAGRPIYVGGTDHSSHRLMLLGLGPRVVLAVLVLATAFSASIGVAVSQGLMHPALAAVVVFIPGLLALVALLRVGRYSPQGGRAQLLRETQQGHGSP